MNQAPVRLYVVFIFIFFTHARREELFVSAADIYASFFHLIGVEKCRNHAGKTTLLKHLLLLMIKLAALNLFHSEHLCGQ